MVRIGSVYDRGLVERIGQDTSVLGKRNVADGTVGDEDVAEEIILKRARKKKKRKKPASTSSAL